MKKIVAMVVLSILPVSVAFAHNMTDIREGARELVWLAVPWATGLGLDSKKSFPKGGVQMTSYFNAGFQQPLVGIANLAALRWYSGDVKAGLAANYAGA